MHKRGFAIWMTGLPSSGKSTLAKLLEQTLRENGMPVVVLDGDEMRQRLTKGLGFSKADRDENISRIAYVSRLLTEVGAVVITAAISPYCHARQRARFEIGNFVEVYVKCPLQTCMKRDVKGLYAKAMRGEIANLTGLSDPYEPPAEPEVIVHTDMLSPEHCVRKMLEKLIALDYLPKHVLEEFSGPEEFIGPPDERHSEVRVGTSTQWSI